MVHTYVNRTLYTIKRGVRRFRRYRQQEACLALKKIVDDAYVLALGTANAILLDGGSELALIDAGFPGKVSIVLDAIRQLGREPSDLRHLIFTHHHPDHIGSAAAIVRETGAMTYMHALDIPIAETGGPFRPMDPAPGLMERFAYRMFWRQNELMEPVHINHEIAEGDTVPVAGGLQVIHTPGHCAGQVAFLWQGERLLIGGDVGMNIIGLSDPLGFEDQEEGRRSQRKIAALRFDAAVFGHGGPIRSGASNRIRKKWGQR